MNSTTTYADPADAKRRHFLLQAGTGAGALTAGLLLNAKPSEGADAPARQARTNAVQSRKGLQPGSFWPGGIRLVVCRYR